MTEHLWALFNISVIILPICWCPCLTYLLTESFKSQQILCALYLDKLHMVFTCVCCWHLDTRLTEVVLYFLVKLLCLVKYSFPLFCFVWLINCSLCAKNNKTHNKPPWVIATWLLPNVWCIWVAAILNYHQILVLWFTYK